MNAGWWVVRWARRGEEGLRGVSPPGRYRSAGGQREEGWIGVKKGEGCWWGEVGWKHTSLWGLSTVEEYIRGKVWA